MDSSTVKNAKLFFGMLSKVYDEREANGMKEATLFSNVAAAVMDSSEPVKEWGISRKASAAAMGSLIKHFRVVVEPDTADLEAVFGDDVEVDLDTLEDFGAGVSVAELVKADAAAKLKELASELEVASMGPEDLLLQTKFLTSRMVLADENAGDTVSRQDLHRLQRELREATSRGDTLEHANVQAKKESSQLRQENEELNKNITGWYTQVEELKPKLAELEKSRDMEIFPLKQKLEFLQNQLDESRRKCSGLESRIETLTAGQDRQTSMDEDAVLELQNAIEEAEGLYKQIDVLDKAAKEQNEKLVEQTEMIGAFESERTQHEVKLTFHQEEVEFLRRKIEFANEGYRDAKLETRNQQREIEALQRQVHDFDFRMMSMDAERAIVMPRLSEDEREGLALLGLAATNPARGDYDRAQELSGMVSRLTTLSTEHKRKVDLEWEGNLEIMNQIKTQLSNSEADATKLKQREQELLIEAGTAKLSRNQFLQLSRDLKEQLNQATVENQKSVDHYLKEMKFFSDQYATLKQTDVALRDAVDLPEVINKASGLETLGGTEWSGVQDDLAEFWGGSLWRGRGEGGKSISI